MNRKGKRQGLPQGATYAQKLAWERKQKDALQEAAKDAMVKVEAEIREAKKRIERDPGSNYERIRMMSVKEMARFIREEILGITGGGAESAEEAWEKWLLEKVKA